MNETKKVRLLISSQSNNSLRDFYWSIVREHSDKLSTAVELFTQSHAPNLITLLNYFARLVRTERHWDFLNLRDRPKPIQSFYSAQDELLTKLQDPSWRQNFEIAYGLYQQYGNCFVTTLHFPTLVSQLLPYIAEKAKQNESTPAAIERVGIVLYRGLTNPQALTEWATKQGGQ